MGIQTVRDMHDFDHANAFQNEIEDRRSLIAGELNFGVPALDYAFKSVLPNDLICVAAKTGSGKTEMLTQIAMNVAQQKKRVDFFALECSTHEIHRRIKYKILSELYIEATGDFNISYSDWARFKLDDKFKLFESTANERLALISSYLRVYYRTATFDVKDFNKMYLSFCKESRLVLADHAQFFTKEDKLSDIEHVRQMTLSMYDMVNKFRTPIILVSHLRKVDSDKNFPDENDLYGASELSKVCTRIMLICRERKRIDLNGYETVFRIAKNREESPLAIRVLFSLSKKKYSDKWVEGQIIKDKFRSNDEMLKEEQL